MYMFEIILVLGSILEAAKERDLCIKLAGQSLREYNFHVGL